VKAVKFSRKKKAERKATKELAVQRYLEVRRLIELANKRKKKS
jgi:hypothetical protein